MATKNTLQIIITVILAVIASALTIIVLEKAGVITFSKAAHAPANVSSNTADFHKGEVEGEHHHHHGPGCGHAEHKHAEHKHTPGCGHAEHKHAEHKHTPDCGHAEPKHAEHHHGPNCGHSKH